MTARHVPLALALAALTFVPLALRADVIQDTEKSVFVTVVDSAGKPVTDLAAGEIGIKEDNVIREVTGVKPATQPLSVVVLADTTRNAGGNAMTGGSGNLGNSGDLTRDIRTSLTAFVRQINAANPESQITLIEFGQAAITMVKPTNKLADVEKGINRVSPKPDAPSVLLEALIEGSNQLIKAPNVRRAMVSLNVEPGDEQSSEQPQKILDSLRKSHASLWSVSLQRGELRNPNRDLVLNQLTKISGGTRDYIVGPSALETTMKNYATYLTSQLEVTYKRPASSATAQQVMVGTTRQNVKFYAGIIAPQ
jgi:hypothetical protein